MVDNTEITLKMICCTCLSIDRKLFQLCRLVDGVNNLYLLLSHDSEAYREGFYKDTANLFICWECESTMRRLSKFREQACTAQRKLSSILEGRTDSKIPGLSHLSTSSTLTYDFSSSCTETNILDNFIDCGPFDDIETEVDVDDVPLSEINENSSNGDVSDDERLIDNKSEVKGTKKMKTFAKHKYYTKSIMPDDDMFRSRVERKAYLEFIDAPFKCETCIEVFKTENCLKSHNSMLHNEKPNHSQCVICQITVKDTSLVDHRAKHNIKYNCNVCNHISYEYSDILEHLKEMHCIGKTILQRKNKKVYVKGSNHKLMKKRIPRGYKCSECNKYFENTSDRWKHVQKCHREGFKCATCGRRFAFRNNLSRHELIHKGPPIREKCEICKKMVRVDLLPIHAKIHTKRERLNCIECQKTFASRASYENHLKYTQAHASGDILKHKCSMCDKGYRSRGELRDHVNYQHMGKTQHQCPVCGKALATRRCITRHVKRAHDGVKECAKDKICQQCGKAFREKKSLREHEMIHTGERPLSCEICGCTFRQSASLYTHKKRVHNIHTKKKSIQLVET